MIERLIDSIILIDHLNGIEKATRFIIDLDPLETAISVITRAEILTGLDEGQQPKVIQLLDQYQLLIVDKPIADLAAKLRREHRWTLPDAFQAALAQHHKIKLTTRNLKDFNPQEHDFVEIPYRL
ncbi:MAG: PIN domain-containing protein [Desulfobacterales bacterium]|nr:MAG: PIN domain-containing protein [Desulfobacterales bacterium]